MNHISLKIRPRCYAKSTTAQFWPIPGLISCTGGDLEMETAVSCIEWSQVADLIKIKVSRSSHLFVQLSFMCKTFFFLTKHSLLILSLLRRVATIVTT